MLCHFFLFFIIFSKSFSEGIIPIQWKLANVTPIYKYKKGNKKLRWNYTSFSYIYYLQDIRENLNESYAWAFGTKQTNLD